MYPLLYILITVIIITLSGFLLAPSTNKLLFAWLWFNIFIDILVLYVIWNKNTMYLYKEKCDTMDFWNTPVSDDFMKDLYGEYSCKCDHNYLEPSNFVYPIEFINAMLVILLWIAYVFNNIFIVKILLLIQAYHCCLYFIHRYYYHGFKRVSNLEEIYLGISALWIICPLALLFILK